MRHYDRVSRAVLDRPMFIREAEGHAIAEILSIRLSGGRFSDDEMRIRLEQAHQAAGPRRGIQNAGDVGVIPIYGTIIPRANMMSDTSGGVSITAIRDAFRTALRDETIASILFEFDSPGGAVDGVEELAAEIRAARGRKPMAAIANTLMCSGAYYLGSQADELIASPSSIVGSIGVFTLHEDYSQMDAAMGVTITIIRQPPAKAETNEYEPLSDEGRAHLQQTIDDYYAQFTGAVAKGRGVTAAAVRDGYGQGRALTAKRAVDAGLADRIGTLDDAIARLATGKVTSPRASATERPIGSTRVAATAEIDHNLSVAVEPDRPIHAGQAALALARARAVVG